MSQIPLGGDSVADDLLEFGDFGEASGDLARPNPFAVGVNLEDSARSRLQGEFGDFAVEGGQQLLRHPGGAQQPAALRAVNDSDVVAQGSILP